VTPADLRWRAVAGRLLLSSLVAASGGACRAPAPPAATAPAGEVWLPAQQVKAARLTIEAVAEHPVGGTIVTNGRVTFHDLQVAHVFSPVNGRVLRIEAAPGQRVNKGDALAVIDSPDVGAAFSDLAKAEADSLTAEHETARQRELYEVHASSQRDYESARDASRKAIAELERARAKARLLKGGKAAGASQTYTLRAVIDGEVIARSVNPGAEVQGQYSGGTAAELFTLGELDPVWIVADVFELDLARVRLGAPVTVRVVAYPNRVFEGRVDWISGSLDPTTRTAKVRCTIPNPGRALKPEMSATVSIAVGGRSKLAVPRKALLRLGDQTLAFVDLGPGPGGVTRFARRPVTVDESEGGDVVPVVRGLARGDRIVVSGAILLSGSM